MAILPTASKLRPTLLELFGRLTSKVTSNWEVWSLYARLVGDGLSDLEGDTNNKALHYLQKALRSSIQRIGWEKDEKSAIENVDLCIRLLGKYVNCKCVGSQQTCVCDFSCVWFYLECVRHHEKNSCIDNSTIVSSRLSVNGVKAKLQVKLTRLLNSWKLYLTYWNIDCRCIRRRWWKKMLNNDIKNLLWN